MDKKESFFDNVSIVSVDFDGVLLKHFLDKNLFKTKYEGIWFYIAGFIDRKCRLLARLWIFIAHLVRKENPGIENVLKMLKDKGVKIYLITSRRDYLSDQTLRWLEDRGFKKYFDKFIFRKKYGDLSVYKGEKIVDGSVGLHIDDDLVTIKYLSERMPDRRFVCLNRSEKFDFSDNVLQVFSWGEVF